MFGGILEAPRGGAGMHPIDRRAYPGEAENRAGGCEQPVHIYDTAICHVQRVGVAENGPGLFVKSQPKI